MTNEIRIDENADWTGAGSGRPGARPGRWYRTDAGQWKRSGLLPYGGVSESYQTRLYTCAECSAALKPTTRPYYFGCGECGLVFGYGWGGLWGYASDHEKAMFLAGGPRGGRTRAEGGRR